MNNSLKTVCDKHNINFSSAKNVIQIFKKEGRLEKKVVRTRKNKKRNESKNDSDLSEDKDTAEADQKVVELEQYSSSCAIILKLEDDD